MNEQMLSQLLEETRVGNRLLKKQLWLTRIAALVLAALVAVLGMLGMTALREVQSAEQMIEEMNLERVADAFEQLDVDGLNRAITGLREQVAALDTDALNQTMEALEGAAGSINEAADRFNRMISFFR